MYVYLVWSKNVLLGIFADKDSAAINANKQIGYSPRIECREINIQSGIECAEQYGIPLSEVPSILAKFGR